MKISFAHIADCHVGAWREPKMRELNQLHFIKTINSILTRHKNGPTPISFCIIAGDLFNTAIPSIDALKIVTEKLKELYDAGIKVVGIAGSHDYSAAGKSMLEVLEKASLFTNVMKGSIEDEMLTLEPTEIAGVKIYGIIGKRGTLDKSTYSLLNKKKIEEAQGPKIFAFHTSIDELLPKEQNALLEKGTTLAGIPKNCTYYAGGHVHIHQISEHLEFGTFAYPGPTCPNSFKEWEDLKEGSYIIGTIEDEKVSLEKQTITSKNVVSITIQVPNLTVDDAKNFISQQIEARVSELTDALVLLRVSGTLAQGTIADLAFDAIQKNMYEKGAYCVLRNTSELRTPAFEPKEAMTSDVNEIEKEIIMENMDQSKLTDLQKSPLPKEAQQEIITSLLQQLSQEKKDGETNTDFDHRLLKEFEKVLRYEI
jgi:exonuclease SbcD